LPPHTHHLATTLVRRADTKSSLYVETIKKGDLLLNRVQKLSKVIDIE
jgi:26S proteasome regulatory subunit N7